MLNFLGSLILFLLLFLFFVLMLGVGFLKSIFGGNRNPKSREYQKYSRPKTKKNKVFEDNEGEYVDFEEID